jgi:hypothetical protein
MKTTVDLPDDLFRKAKAEAALRGVKFKDLIQEGLLRVLELSDTPKEVPSKSLYDLMKGACGIVSSGTSDLASNAIHMEEFGRD